MDTKIKVTGKCEYVGPVEKPRENFTKRAFVLGETTDNGKTRFLQFTLMGERVKYVTEAHKGKMLEVSGYIESRQFVDKNGMPRFWTDIKAVFVREIEGSDTAAAIPLAEGVGGVDDDMPF